MIVNEEYNNKSMRTNADSMICDKNQEFKFKSFAKEYFNLCSCENRKTGVKCGLNQNKRQDITKLNKRHYHLQKYIMFNT